MQRYWDIYKENSRDGFCTTLQASSEKEALKKYQKGLTSSGFYNITRHPDGILTLDTTYGGCFRAYPSTKVSTRRD
ncbi:MAG: hypothetical protein LUE86_08025 [Clostridiales bacterium]|nr:hypothetical protein [Clostridiales bacterium]